MSISGQKTLLLVEDDLLTARAQALALNDLGYQVISAATGEQAVSVALSEEEIHLALIDIDLGEGIDGAEVARQILQGRSLPVIFLTCHSSREMKEKIGTTTRYGYVTKDSGELVLQLSIEAAFELFEAQRQLKEELSRRRQVEQGLNHIVERQKSLIRTAISEKEFLVKEVHRHVKNNLQMISGILKLQAVHAKDRQVRTALNDGQRRVQSVALVHQTLQRSRDLSRIDFGEYLDVAVRGFGHDFGRPDVILAFEVEPIRMEANRAIPCALIVNELIANSMKHAFPGHRGGTIVVSLHRKNPSAVVLKVSDDGVGMGHGLDLSSARSIGLSFVYMLTEQVFGTVEQEAGLGTTTAVTFPG